MQSVVGAADRNYGLEMKEAVQISMHTFADQIEVVDDLKVCLMRNYTAVPFITSDDPAILTNRWYLNHTRRSHLSFGLGNAGLLFLLPMSPSVLCLGYDGDVYSVPHESGWVRVRREADIEAFNEHQFLNCRANIFVGKDEHKEYVQAAYHGVADRRLSSRHVLEYAVLDRQEGNLEHYRVVDSPEAEQHEKAIIHIQDKRPIPSKWPSQITWRTNGCAYSNGTGINFVREPHARLRGGPPFQKVPTRPKVLASGRYAKQRQAEEHKGSTRE
jgi:hypothetical protein